MTDSTVRSPEPLVTDSESSIASHSTTDTVRMLTSNQNQTVSTPTAAQYANVTKLTSTTFHNWKLRLETLLGAYKLRRFILEDITPPTDPSLLETHQTSDFQALSAIHSTIDDESFQIVSSCTTAYQAYEAICRHHGDTGGISTATLFFELVNLRVTSDISIKDHVHQFPILLLFSLPSDFAPLVQTTLTTTAFDKIDINHLYMLILVSNTVENSDSAAHNNNTAMVAAASKDRKSYPKTDRSERYKNKTSSDDPPKCSRGHIGHTDDRCRIQISEAKDK